MRHLVALLLLLLLPRAAFADGCPDLVALLGEAGRALDEVRLDDARDLVGRADAALRCQPTVVGSLALQSLYQLGGAIHFFLGEYEEADRYFARAVAVSPGSTLPPEFGSDPAHLYDNVRERVLRQPPASLVAAPDVAAWLDGRPLAPDMPTDVVPGSHLLQVRGEGGALLDLVVVLRPGQRSRVAAGGTLEPLAAPVAAPAAGSAPVAARPWKLYLGAGAGAAGAGGLSLGLAAWFHARFDATNDLDQLVSLQRTTNTFAILGFVLGGAGMGLVTVGLASRPVTVAVAPNAMLMGWRW